MIVTARDEWYTVVLMLPVQGCCLSHLMLTWPGVQAEENSKVIFNDGTGRDVDVSHVAVNSVTVICVSISQATGVP